MGIKPDEISQSANRAKNFNRFEDHIAAGMGKFMDLDLAQEPINKPIKSLTKELRICVGHTGGGQIEHML